MAVHVETPIGLATLESLTALVDRLDVVAAADPDLLVIVDQTDFDYSTMDRALVQQVAGYWEMTAHARHLRRIAIVAPDSTAFGLTRMGVSYAEANETAHVFRTRSEAEAWLRL